MLFTLPYIAIQAACHPLLSTFFFRGEKESSKEKRHFGAIAPLPKGASLRIMSKLVILFVCAGTAAQVCHTPFLPSTFAGQQQ